MNKKTWIIIVLLAITITACSQPATQPATQPVTQTDIQATISAGIDQTQTAQEAVEPTSAPTNAPTNTPKPTSTPKPTNTPKPTDPPSLGTFSNPLPFGDEVPMKTTDEGITFVIKVEEVIRGDEAWSIIYKANKFNDPPPDGFEAILVKIYIKNTSSAGFLELSKYDSLALATKGNVLDGFFYSPCCLDNAGLVEFDVKLNPSGEHTGWFASAVHIDENSPMLVVGADRSGKGGVYFSLN